MSYFTEQNIIGSLFTDESCIEQIYNIVEPEMFSSELLGRIYLEFQRGYDNNIEMDIPLIVRKVQDEHFPEWAIMEEIKSCISQTITSANVKHYAETLAREHKAKRLSDLLNKQVITAENVDNLIPSLMNDLEAMLENRTANSKSLPVIVRENKGNYFRESNSPKIDLGFRKLDELLGGLEGGEMVVIGARPAVGKSAFVTQIAYNLSKRGKKVGFYNLEMQEKQIYERFVSQLCGIGLSRIRRALEFNGDEKERFDKANEELEKRDSIIITTGSKAVSEIRTESRHMGYDVIIIDYMQLLKPDRTYRGNRYAEVGAISKAIKGLAMELNIPIIALSQLNRVSEAREDKEPSMAEIRESGDIEQDAGVIILLWNMDKEDKTKKGCKIEKQRQGKTGTVELVFNGDKMKFSEIGGDDWEAYGVEETPFD